MKRNILKLNQKGVGHHLMMFFLVVLVIGATGFAGYRVYQTRFGAKAESRAPINGDILATGGISYSHDGKFKTLNDVFNNDYTYQSIDTSDIDNKVSAFILSNGKHLEIRNRNNSNIVRVFTVDENLYTQGRVSWSPDATKLAYSLFKRNEDGSLNREIWITNSDGTNNKLISSALITENNTSNGPHILLDWINNEQLIYSKHDNTAFQLCRISNTGIETSCIRVENTSYAPGTQIVTNGVSPDKSTIMIRYKPDSTSSESYRLVNISDGTILKELPITTFDRFRNVTWSPDSKKFAYCGAFIGNYNHVYTVNIDGTNKIDFGTQPCSALGWQKRQLYYYTPINPVRIADTRPNSGLPYSGGNLKDVNILGVGGLPKYGVEAVVVNVTGVRTSTSKYTEALIAEYNTSLTSYLYTDTGFHPNGEIFGYYNQTSISSGGTQVILRPDSNGNIHFSNSQSSTPFGIIDVVGYYSSLSNNSFAPIGPTRLADTRPNSGKPYAGKTIAANSNLSINIAGSGGVPAGASAAVLNIVAVAPSSNGYITAFPSGATKPQTSSLNFSAGNTTSKESTIKIGTNGQVTFFNGSGSSINIVVDVLGYFVPTKTELSFVPTISRFNTLKIPSTVTNIDTRPNVGSIGQGKTVVVEVLNNESKIAVPSEAQVVVLKICAAGEGKGSGNIVVYPDGTVAPSTSSINFNKINYMTSSSPNWYFAANRNAVCNEATVKIGANGKIAIKNNSTTDTAYVNAAVMGYYY